MTVPTGGLALTGGARTTQQTPFAVAPAQATATPQTGQLTAR
jgi:hypothetical protein